MTDEQYKKLSIDEFTKAAAKYEGNHAGIYEMCKKDYPEILEELEQEPFQDLLDAGCGPAPMISLLVFVVGDCENFPFEENSFDAIICSSSFHHYPNPQAFFHSVKKCLRPGGRLILRDLTSENKLVLWFMDKIELPLANLCGHGDVTLPTKELIAECCKNAGLTLEKMEFRKGMRMHCVVRK